MHEVMLDLAHWHQTRGDEAQKRLIWRFGLGSGDDEGLRNFSVLSFGSTAFLLLMSQVEMCWCGGKGRSLRVHGFGFGRDLN